MLSQLFLWYIYLAEAIQDTVAFYASRLQDAMDRSGTNDTQLIRIIVSRSEVYLSNHSDLITCTTSC